MFPPDKKKLKERINRYRRSLKTGDSDGSGKRFLVGPMYLLLGDLNGAIQYYDWYKTAFPDDGPEPFSHLCWSLALYMDGKLVEAATKLAQTMFSNLYLVPHVLGEHQQPLKIWHGSNWAELDYAMDLPTELYDLWDTNAKTWAASVLRDPSVISERERFVEIESRLLDVKPGPERTALVTVSFRIREGKGHLKLAHRQVTGKRVP